MTNLSRLKIALATGLVAGLSLAPAAASAGETRSSAAVPKAGLDARAKPQAGTDNRSTSQGPRDGFPDNRGLENAREHANDNAAFKRRDSEG